MFLYILVHFDVGIFIGTGTKSKKSVTRYGIQYMVSLVFGIGFLRYDTGPISDLLSINQTE